MDKVLVNTNVIQGIISAYHHADQDQTRIYGIILGSKKDNIYHVTDAVYGFIFESENTQKNKKELVKMNEDSLKSLFNSLTQKFKLNNPGVNVSKNSKEKEIKFQNNDTLAILGGFVTDKELLNDLYRLHATLDRVSPEIFCNVENINKIILLIDPNYQNTNDIKYGIKTYEWNTRSIKFKKFEKTSSFIVFKELQNEVVQQGNNLDMSWGNNLFGKIYNVKIEKNDKKNINELLFEEKKGEDKAISNGNNNDFIKMKINETLNYLNLFQQLMENDEKADKDDKLTDDDYDKIAYIMSQLTPILEDKEIVNVINRDIDNKYSVDSLAQLLDVQLNLSDKIRELIK
jgi:hypothetical protein